MPAATRGLKTKTPSGLHCCFVPCPESQEGISHLCRSHPSSWTLMVLRILLFPTLGSSAARHDHGISSSKHPLMCVDLCKRWWPCNPHPAAFALEAAWLQHLCLTLLILSALPGAEPPCAVWGDNPVPGGRGAGMGARLAQPHQQGRAAWSWAPLCPGRLDVLDHCSQHWPGLVRALPAPLHQMGAEGLPGSP